MTHSVTESIVVDISLSADEYLRFYAGSARHVVARSRDGRSIRFPANILQRFVTRTGIHGSFEIQFDSSGKFCGIKRLA